jgi:hypothetical protein
MLASGMEFLGGREGDWKLLSLISGGLKTSKENQIDLKCNITVRKH